jgi:hypothetical protein
VTTPFTAVPRSDVRLLGLVGILGLRGWISGGTIDEGSVAAGGSAAIFSAATVSIDDKLADALQFKYQQHLLI